MQRRRDAGGGAVGVGDDVSAVAVGGLVLHGLQLIGVDLGDHDGDVGVHPVGSRVGEDSHAGLGQLGLGGAGQLGGYSAECDPAVLRDLLDVHGLDLAVHGLVEVDVVPHLHDVRQPLAAGPLGGVQPLDLEPGMVLQHLDEPLADHAARTEHCYANLAHGMELQLLRPFPRVI